MSAAAGAPRPRDLALLVLVAGLWSSSFLLIKVALPAFPPFTLAAARLAIGAAVLLPFALRAGGPRLDAQTVGAMIFVGLFGNALPFTLIGWGELRVDSALAAVMMGVMPISTLVMAHLVFADERLTRGRLLGVTLGFAGVLTLVGWQALAGAGGDVAHELAVLGGAFSYAVATVFTRRFVRRTGPVMAAGAVLAGSLALLPMALTEARPWADGVTLEAGAALLTLGLLPTGLAALIYFHLVKTLGASRFAQVNFLIPVFGVVWGTLFLDERPGMRLFVALALILLGLVLVTRRERRPGAGSG